MALPRVNEKTRELIAREFDVRGPDVCMVEIIEHLRRHNPELLDMAAKWAGDLDNPRKACSASACSTVSLQLREAGDPVLERDDFAIGDEAISALPVQ